jgi:hypothetical protein
LSIGIDRAPSVIAAYRKEFGSGYRFVLGRAEEFLSRYRYDGTEFVYLDPPYPRSTCLGSRSLYRFGYTQEDHRRLLELVRSLPCAVMISGRPNELYAARLADWIQAPIRTVTRMGVAADCVWMNYQPHRLHDCRYIGGDFRERQAIKRQRDRWVRRFRRASRPVQQALLTALTAVFQEAGR